MQKCNIAEMETRRDKMLEAVKETIPELHPYVLSCYSLIIYTLFPHV